MSSLFTTLKISLLCFSLILQTIFTTNAFEIPQQLKSQAKKLHERCQKQTGVSEDLIRQTHEGIVPNVPLLKCYIHCLLETVGLIDADHIIRLENMKDLLPQETHSIIQNLVDKCGTQAGNDGCDTAYQTVKCYFDADKVSLMAAFGFLFD